MSSLETHINLTLPYIVCFSTRCSGTMRFLTLRSSTRWSLYRNTVRCLTCTPDYSVRITTKNTGCAASPASPCGARNVSHRMTVLVSLSHVLLAGKFCCFFPFATSIRDFNKGSCLGLYFFLFRVRIVGLELRVFQYRQYALKAITILYVFQTASHDNKVDLPFAGSIIR